jgi:hypothetical protein
LAVTVLPITFLTSVLDEWLALRPGHCACGERTSGTNLLGYWVDPRAGVDAVTKREALHLAVMVHLFLASCGYCI